MELTRARGPSKLPAHMMDMALALAMGLHARLGSACPLRLLSDHLLEIIFLLTTGFRLDLVQTPPPL